jgi:hypothetical protein
VISVWRSPIHGGLTEWMVEGRLNKDDQVILVQVGRGVSATEEFELDTNWRGHKK